jgi:hypothetical protein
VIDLEAAWSRDGRTRDSQTNLASQVQRVSFAVRVSAAVRSARAASAVVFIVSGQLVGHLIDLRIVHSSARLRRVPRQWRPLVAVLAMSGLSTGRDDARVTRVFPFGDSDRRSQLPA